jgi:hypothetical protein
VAIFYFNASIIVLTLLFECDIIRFNNIEFNIMRCNRRIDIEIKEAPWPFLEDVAGVPIL